jgi:hypothetical protein
VISVKSSISFKAWMGLSAVIFLMIISGILVGRIIFGQADRSTIWLPIASLSLMVVLAGTTGWNIGAARQKREKEGR